jgi:hypothetical protein
VITVSRHRELSLSTCAEFPSAADPVARPPLRLCLTPRRLRGQDRAPTQLTGTRKRGFARGTLCPPLPRLVPPPVRSVPVFCLSVCLFSFGHPAEDRAADKTDVGNKGNKGNGSTGRHNRGKRAKDSPVCAVCGCVCSAQGPPSPSSPLPHCALSAFFSAPREAVAPPAHPCLSLSAQEQVGSYCLIHTVQHALGIAAVEREGAWLALCAHALCLWPSPTVLVLHPRRMWGFFFFPSVS